MSLEESGYTANALTERFHMPSIQDGWNFRRAWILISYNRLIASNCYIIPQSIPGCPAPTEDTHMVYK